MVYGYKIPPKCILGQNKVKVTTRPDMVKKAEVYVSMAAFKFRFVYIQTCIFVQIFVEI